VTARAPTVSGYTLGEPLGEGGTGIVYLAEQTGGVRRKVAIKVAKPGMQGDGIAELFAAERSALARMDHENVARVLDGGTTHDGRAFLVVEHVAGEPITECCARHGLTTRARIELVRGACLGVQHAHQKGVLHCDLKPSNILVARADDAWSAKVVDFGLARTPGVSAVTDGGGTPAYLSPEQLFSETDDLDARADVFALGLVLYELVTGRHPWITGEPCGLIELRRRLSEDAPEAPSTLVPGEASADLDAVILRALAVDRERRYDTPGALAADLSRWLAGSEVEARVPGRRERLVRFVRRNRAGVGLGAAVFVALVVGSGSTLASFVDAEHALTRARDARRDAERSERDALAELRRFDVLAGFVRLEQARAAMRELYPVWPEQLPAMRAWRQQFEAPLAELRVSPDATKADEGFLRETLDELAAGLREFFARDVPRVHEWITWAERVERLTLDEPRALWNRTIEAVRHNPHYGGLELFPQLGLIPVGADPDTGLFEFAQPRSGRVPRRDASGKLGCDGETAIVFVLVPAGAARIGARTDDAGATRVEKPVHTVALDAFFLAKHEMSQGQWLRLTGDDPAWFRAGRTVEGVRYTLAHPVENVDWHTCRDVLRKSGLELPTEVQWEYACRAGTETPWWTGASSETLTGAINIADGFDDGFPGTAPVHTLRANPFGLHHVCGNVAEWCADAFVGYERWPEPGTGLRAALGTQRVQRGGSWISSGPVSVRSASRSVGRAGQASQACGLRAARAIMRR